MFSRRSIFPVFCCTMALCGAGCAGDTDPAAVPTASDAAYAITTAAACTGVPWIPGTTYLRNTVVTHAGHDWKAKKTNTGIVPGTSTTYWADLGACGTAPPPVPPTPMQIFGAWHAGSEYASWSTVRDMAEFDLANHWLIDRGDGSRLPSVNLVVLSFVNPLKLLNRTTDAGNLDGIPRGMTQDIVDYFKNAGVRVMLSIGGVTYTDYWNQALATDPTQLGLNAAAVAAELGVGIEIDYEQNTSPNLVGLQAFVDAYRSVHPYDATGVNHAARLTIDLAAGGRYLQALNRYATANWLRTDAPVLDYANAMVARSSGTPDTWQEHVDGMPTYAPPIPPKAPAKFTGGLYLKGDMANCRDFAASEQKKYAEYVQTVVPSGAGTTAGMLGYMFWAAEKPSARAGYTATTPPNTCEGGMGVAASTFVIPVPMPPLRQN